MDKIAFDAQRGAVEIWRIYNPAKHISPEIGYEGHSDDRDRSNNSAGTRLANVISTETQALAHLSGHKCLEIPVKWRSTFFCHKRLRQIAITRIAIDLIKKSPVAKTTCELFKGVDRPQKKQKLVDEKNACTRRKPF